MAASLTLDVGSRPIFLWTRSFRCSSVGPGGTATAEEF